MYMYMYCTCILVHLMLSLWYGLITTDYLEAVIHNGEEKLIYWLPCVNN